MPCEDAEAFKASFAGACFVNQRTVVRSKCLQDLLKKSQAGVGKEADHRDVAEFDDDFTPTCARLERKRPPSEISTEMRENIVRGFCQM